MHGCQRTLLGQQGCPSRIERGSLGTLEPLGLKENISFPVSCQRNGNTHTHTTKKASESQQAARYLEFALK